MDDQLDFKCTSEKILFVVVLIEDLDKLMTVVNGRKVIKSKKMRLANGRNSQN